MNNTGKILRLDSGRFDLSDDLVLVCIPEWFRATLLDMTHRMLWSRVWTDSSGNERVLSENDRQRIEFGIYQLSMEECDMVINNYVDVNCGGCGSSVPTTLYCVLPDGTPVITPQPQSPTEPQIPGGGTLPLDPDVDNPPEGFVTWTEYDSYACSLANMMWWFVYYFLGLAETLIDSVATVAVLLTLIAPLLPAGVIAAIGGVTLLDVLWQLVQIITSEQASDILNELRTWMTENRSDLICYVFSRRYSYGQTAAIEAGMLAEQYVSSVLTLDASEKNAIQTMVSTLFGFTVFWGFVASKLVDTFGQDAAFPAYDCSLCDAGNVNIELAAAALGTGSTFSRVSSSHSSIRAAGYLGPYGAGAYKWGWVSPVQSIEALFAPAAIHGVEFTVVELSDPVGHNQFKCRGIGIGHPSPGQRILVHDGTLSDVGFDASFSGTPTSGLWGPAMNVSQISSGVLSTDGGQASAPAGDYVIDVISLYWLDASGNRLV